jgi:hypothetical protein
MRSLRPFVLLALLATAAPALAAPRDTPPLSELRAQAARSRAEQLRATREYKASLERLLALREDDVQRALEQRERTRALVDQGIVARNDLDASERALADARARLDETWNEAVVAASLITKALAYDELAAGPRLAPGGERATASLIRHQGRRAWTLRLASMLEDFFRRTFSRALPVSAYGQTPVHDKLGFDHRNALDLAIHPDTAEGRAVMDWLRRAGLPFIAFRGAVSGSATGAHIHVGEPSARVASPSARATSP